MAKITLKLALPSQQGMTEGILDAFAAKLESAIRGSLRGMRNSVAFVVHEAILASTEVSSLLNGPLRHELGVEDPVDTVNAVATAVAEGVHISSLGVRRAGLKLTGGVKIEILRSDLSEVLEARGGVFTSENGYEVPWLKWLTTAGDAILVADHHFISGHDKWSRTGDGIMIHGGSWHIPPQVSGTPDDNWVTRAIYGAVEKIQGVVSKEISRSL